MLRRKITNKLRKETKEILKFALKCWDTYVKERKCINKKLNK